MLTLGRLWWFLALETWFGTKPFPSVSMDLRFRLGHVLWLEFAIAVLGSLAKKSLKITLIAENRRSVKGVLSPPLTNLLRELLLEGIYHKQILHMLLFNKAAAILDSIYN